MMTRLNDLLAERENIRNAYLSTLQGDDWVFAFGLGEYPEDVQKEIDRVTEEINREKEYLIARLTALH